MIDREKPAFNYDRVKKMMRSFNSFMWDTYIFREFLGEYDHLRIPPFGRFFSRIAMHAEDILRSAGKPLDASKPLFDASKFIQTRLEGFSSLLKIDYDLRDEIRFEEENPLAIRSQAKELYKKYAPVLDDYHFADPLHKFDQAAWEFRRQSALLKPIQSTRSVAQDALETHILASADLILVYQTRIALGHNLLGEDVMQFSRKHRKLVQGISAEGSDAWKGNFTFGDYRQAISDRSHNM